MEGENPRTTALAGRKKFTRDICNLQAILQASKSRLDNAANAVGVIGTRIVASWFLVILIHDAARFLSIRIVQWMNLWRDELVAVALS